MKVFQKKDHARFQGEMITKWRNLEILLSRTTGPTSTNHGTKHPWVKGNQVCSNEGPHSFSRADINEIAKIHWGNSHSRIFFLKWYVTISGERAPIVTTRPFSERNHSLRKCPSSYDCARHSRSLSSMQHLLWYVAFGYNGHLWGPVIRYGDLRPFINADL